MAPPKRSRLSTSEESLDIKSKVKRVTKADIEKQICRRKLDALEQEELKNSDDRFSSSEKRIILEAYSERGFTIFQNVKVLQQYLPTRTESDLRGLVERLRIQSTTFSEEVHSQQIQDSRLNKWQSLCNQLMGTFVKDPKINLEDCLQESLLELAPLFKSDSNDVPQHEPDYPELMRSFAQLLAGRFPDDMSPRNARVSLRLYEHLCGMVDSLDLDSIASNLRDAKWLESSQKLRAEKLEMAIEGLAKLDQKLQKSLTPRDLDTDRDIEALCLELPKIKRITDVLNPLSIDDTLVDSLISSETFVEKVN